MKAVLIGLVMSVLLFTPSFLARPAAQPPSGFVRETVADFGDQLIAAFEVLPTGHFLAGLRNGEVWIFDPEVGLPENPFYQLSTSQVHEGGIIGAAVDPDFDVNRRIYLTYTESRDGVRWVTVCTLEVDVDDPTRAVPGSYSVLLDFLDSTSVIHFGGGLLFLPDKTLLMGSGDSGVPENSQDPTNYRGGILRMNRDGSVPSDNPTFNGVRSHLYALGLRNPFRLFMDPIHNQPYVIDVGAVSWEEINPIYPGANYGWPIFEGMASNRPNITPPPNYVDPALALTQSTNAGLLRVYSLTDGIVYTGTKYPKEFHNQMIIIDWGYTYTRFILVDQDEYGIITSARHWFDEPWGPGTDLVLHNEELYFASAKYGGFNQPFSDSTISRLRYTGIQKPDVRITAEKPEGDIPFASRFHVIVDDGPTTETASVTWTLNGIPVSFSPGPIELGFTTPGMHEVAVEVSIPGFPTSGDSILIRGKEPYVFQLSGHVSDITYSPRLLQGRWEVRRLVDDHVEASGAIVDGVPVQNSGSISTTGEPLKLVYSAGGGIVPRAFNLTHEGTEPGYVFSSDVELSSHVISGTVVSTRGEELSMIPWELRKMDRNGQQEEVIMDSVVASGWNDFKGLLYIPLPIDQAGREYTLTFNPDGSPVYTSPSHDFIGPYFSTVPMHVRIGYLEGGEDCHDITPSGAEIYFSSVESIFMAQCAGCHGLSGAAVDLVLTEGFALTQLLDRQSREVPGLSLVDSSNPERSYLLEKINCADPQVGRVMPVSGFLPSEQRQTIIDWIMDGQRVDPEPAISLHTSSTDGTSPLVVNFIAGANFPAIQEDFQWRFSEGEAFTSAGPKTTHVFTADETPTSHVVTLRVHHEQSDLDLEETLIVMVQPSAVVEPGEPVAGFAIVNPIVLPYVPVVFDAAMSKSPNGAILLYEWDFSGDGEVDYVGSSPVASHVFEEAGVYTISLTVLDQVNTKSTIQAEILVRTGDATFDGHLIQLY
ncbi:MAG: PQQ-dependent sugar dehydrogenase [Candidatus Sumerlaeia bacterium]|nr:PQQ-dependent sugar dehydrogenase [Candidatus Sumerlaeia bacterium]